MALEQIIDDNYSTLLRCLEPSYELLGRLRSIPSVKDRMLFIKQQETLNDKVDALLTALLEAPGDRQESVMSDFIAALRACGQEHVANIFRRESSKVHISDERRGMLLKKTAELCEFLDPENGLLDKLLSAEVFTSDNVDRICNKVGFRNKTKELISIILRKSDETFQALIDSLIETGQSHVVYILTGEGDSRPVSEDNRKKLREKRDLIHSIIPHDLMIPLISNDVFTSYDQERVEGRRTYDDKGEMMWDLISRKSQAAFEQFIEILRQNHHEHVAEWLMGPEVSATVDVSVEEPGVDVQNLEGAIRENMLQTLADDETELKREFTRNGFSLSEVLQSSIIVKFTYEDHAALMSLQKLYRSKKLDELFSEAFRPRFADRGLTSLRVVISDEEFQRHCELQLMTDGHRRALRSLAEDSFDKVSVSDDFLEKLSLCKQRRDIVMVQASREQQVKTLLDIISRQPDSAFIQLLNALDDTHQTEAAADLRRFEDVETIKTEHLIKEESR